MISVYATGSKIYEVYKGLWKNGNAKGCNGQIWDATINNLAMGKGASSADESGQPILQGLCQRAEALSGVPKHALRINLSENLMNGRKMSASGGGYHYAPADTLEGHLYIWPARKGSFNAAYDNTDSHFAFGALLRLKPTLSFSTTGWPTECLNIVKELQQYGAYVADIAGSTDKVSLIGTANETEPGTFRYYLKKIMLTDFEVVNATDMMANDDSLRAIPLCHSGDPNDPCSGDHLQGGGGEDLAVAFRIVQILPNPTTGETRIGFLVPHAAAINLSILDAQGRQVALIASGIFSPGRHLVAWDGSRAKPGVYFARYVAGRLTTRALSSFDRRRRIGRIRTRIGSTLGPLQLLPLCGVGPLNEEIIAVGIFAPLAPDAKNCCVPAGVGAA